MNIKYRRIGIVGGMGPDSTLDFTKELIGLFQQEGIYKDGDFPSIIASVTAPDLPDVVEEIGDRGKILEVLVNLVRDFEGRADFFVMPCNTIHLFYDELKSYTSLDSISIVNATRAEVQRDGYKTIGLLGTKQTIESHIYTRELERNGIRVITPEDIGTVTRIITQVMKGGSNDLQTRDEFKSQLQTMKNKGAEGVILGCTELPLLVDQNGYNIKLYNTTTLLAKATFEYAKKA